MPDKTRIAAAIAVLQSMDPDSDEYKELLAGLNRRVDPRKPFKTPLFDSITLLSWSIAFEAVWIRERGGRIWVYLRKRSLFDTAYAGLRHAAGTAARPGEGKEAMNTLDVISRRLAKAEFGVEGGFSSYHFVENFFNPREERGSFLSIIFLVDFDRDVPPGETGEWFPVDQLPENMVPSHRDVIIPKAFAAWRLLKEQG